MPVWWPKKAVKAHSNGGGRDQDQQQGTAAAPDAAPLLGFAKSARVKSEGNRKLRSFDEVFPRNSPLISRDVGSSTGTGGFSGFDSDGGGSGGGGLGGGERKGIPLPLPTGVSMVAAAVTENGSVSSSMSSSASSDDHQIVSNVVHAPIGTQRGPIDAKYDMRSRSPGPSSRGPTSPTSPLHPRLASLNMDSPTRKQDEGKNQCHPLPLPPGSPSSPSALSNRLSGMVDSPTTSLSKWKKGRFLGRGTFGHVYLGFNSEGGRMCAIKEVRVASDDRSVIECLKQLHQEINLLSRLCHPNIVRYYGSELSEETLSVYLEYVSGGSIHKLLHEYGAFSEPVIRNYARQITSGLAYLHGRNVVHRDIKGANILVGPSGEIKLADFGMAKHTTSSASMLSFKGSPYWMAPEVVMNSNGYSLAVDVWSLGCTILEMATAKPPWSQYEVVAAIFKIGNSKDMPEIPDHLSNEAKSFIRLCLQREPSARPTASQLLDHPFVRDQSTSKAPNIIITRDASPSSPSIIDGSRTPPALDLNSNRGSLTPDLDYMRRPVAISSPSRSFRSPRDELRAITSLPVSPCSSPMRQFGVTTHRSCYPSPPHPAFAPFGQIPYMANDYTVYQTRPTTKFALEPWNDLLNFSNPSSSGSPKRALI
ncbi:hypothetical protein MLD38_028428 [Melastoma candidum]|uniref:Uncharacterized protein n=1 Tax=Melastoma candidum TaxID=119954 RepID=A0ACB9N2S2_9MYRT|nr:hypothetical protein MLD38_028428 [Melastoma candidum]